MNQYLNETNQNMIWKVINNAPQIIQYFQNYPTGTKEKWFQSIIGNIYKQFNGSSLSLKELNKRTLDFMLQSIEAPQSAPLNNNQQQQGSFKDQQPGFNNQQQQQPVFDHNNTVKPREQILNEQFEMRKKEYESMVKKPVPKAEFANAIKDDVINDIGSAVEEYMKQRNADIPAYAPIKTNEEIKLNVEELPELKKRVQWGDNSERTFDNQQPVVDYTEKIRVLEARIQQMDAIINGMIGRIESLEQRVDKAI
jgi:hypothetical protein